MCTSFKPGTIVKVGTLKLCTDFKAGTNLNADTNPKAGTTDFLSKMGGNWTHQL